MPQCYAKGCKSRRHKKCTKQLEQEISHGNISFHRFPRIPEERKKWLDSIGLDASNVPETASLCSQHFKEKDLDRTSLACTRLRSGAVPFTNIFEEYSTPRKEELSQKQCKISNEDTVIQQETMCHSMTQQIFDTKRKETADTIQCDDHSIESYTYVSGAVKIEPSNTGVSSEAVFYENSCISPRKEFRTCGTVVSPRISENSPRKKMLRSAFDNMRKVYQKKIKILQQKQRRSAKTIARLKDVLAVLRRKNLLDAHSCLKRYK